MIERPGFDEVNDFNARGKHITNIFVDILGSQSLAVNHAAGLLLHEELLVSLVRLDQRIPSRHCVSTIRAYANTLCPLHASPDCTKTCRAR